MTRIREWGILVLVLAMSGTATAATRSWTGATSNLWSVGTNWSGGVAPVAGDDLVFPLGASNVNNTNDLVSASFNSIAVTAGAYVLGGNPVTLGSGGFSASASGTVNLGIVLGASQTWSVSIPTYFTIAGAIDLGGNTLTLATATNFGFQLQGVVSGTGSIVVAAGRSIFLGADTWSGGLTINGGVGAVNSGSITSTATVNAGGEFAIATNGTASAVNVNSGGTFFPGDTGLGLGTVGTLTLVSGATYEEILNGTGSGVFGHIGATGAVDLGGSTLTIQAIGVFNPGDAWTMISPAAHVTNTFAGLPEGAVFNQAGQFFQITYSGGAGNDVVLTALGATPVELQRFAAE